VPPETAAQGLCGVREWTILLTNRWSTRWEPIGFPVLASPPKQWDPKPGTEAPLYIAGSQKRLTRHRRRLFSTPIFPYRYLLRCNKRRRPWDAVHAPGANPGGRFFSAPSIVRPRPQEKNPIPPQLAFRQLLAGRPTRAPISAVRCDSCGRSDQKKRGGDVDHCHATASARRRDPGEELGLKGRGNSLTYRSWLWSPPPTRR
jgi:hypothetical protein